MLRHLFSLVSFLCCVLLIHSSTCGEESEPTVLLAILARNKAHVLPKFLNSIDNLDYNKQLITVYINTNNNQDDTLAIIEKWMDKNRGSYKHIEVESHEIAGASSTRPHEWTSDRFKLLGTIRNKSLQKTKDYHCDYYFVVDCDNFIAPFTLKELIHKKLPIVAPLLYPIPEDNDPYSNYFCAVSENGYYQDHPDYLKILQRQMVGTFKVPVVHCTYLIQSTYLDKLTYVDGTHDYEFVIFSRSARNNHVDQYICNEKLFGTLIHFRKDLSLEEEKNRIDQFFSQ